MTHGRGRRHHRPSGFGTTTVPLAASLLVAGCMGDPARSERSSARHVAVDSPETALLLAAAPCTDCVVLHHVLVDLPLTGVQFLAGKVADTTSGASFDVAVRPDGTPIDGASAIAREADTATAAHGTFEPALDDDLRAARPDDRVKAWVWLKTVEGPEDRELLRTDAGARESSVAAHHAMLHDVTAPVAAELAASDAVATAFADAPVIDFEGTKDVLDGLRRDARVAAVYRHPGVGIPACRTYVQGVQADLAQAAGWTGAGLTVSEKEGPQPDDYSLLSVVEVASPAGWAHPHARAVLGIMRTNAAPFGISPGATQYMANEDGYSGPPPSLDGWLNDRVVRVRNVSGMYDYPCPSGDLHAHDRWVDYVVTHYPYPFFAVAAGNQGDVSGCDRVGHKCYNCLQVGSSDEHGTTSRADDTMAAFSSWRNPTTTYGDRELPALVAPGVQVEGAGICGDGTSLSSPMVAGTAAAVYQRNPVLQSYPETLWALARVHANQNVDGPWLHLTDGVDDRDGAGELNTYRTAYWAGSAYKRNGGGAAATTGYDYGLMRAGLDFPGNYYVETYNITPVAGCTVVASLAWDSEAACNPSDCSRPAYCSCTYDSQGFDMDLRLFRNSSWVTGSYSYDNTYEYMRYTVPAGTTSLQLKVWYWSGNANQTYFGLSWQVYC